mmetsp:Transcript_2271/g.4773  ORF Transcript_2271/g.4773 Transcript_2271/m.4773 type:complete len:372 (-) Transcript_2271:159-1274(-)
MLGSLSLLGRYRQPTASATAAFFSASFERPTTTTVVGTRNLGAISMFSSLSNSHSMQISNVKINNSFIGKGLVSDCHSSDVTRRSHYSYSDGPGRFPFSDEANAERHSKRLQTWSERGFTVGIGGPVGSGKTALVLALIKRLGAAIGKNGDNPPLAVVTNDIFTQEDAQFLWRHQDVLPSAFIKAVETGGCPHAAIREDVSANLTACEDLTDALMKDKGTDGSSSLVLPPLILCESGGDNLAANFSNELADLTLYVIDVAGGDKVPRKGGPGITQSDLLVINKIDLAPAVGADLDVMRRDADRMRSTSVNDHNHSHDHDHNHGHDHDHSHEESSTEPTSGPTVFASVRDGISLDDIEGFILEKYRKATTSA